MLMSTRMSARIMFVYLYNIFLFLFLKYDEYSEEY